MQCVPTLTLLLIWISSSLFSQSNFSSDFNFGINFYSANRENIVIEFKKPASIYGQYEYCTQIYNYNSLQKDSAKVIEFITALNQKVLNKKITPFLNNFHQEYPVFLAKPAAYFFYKTDTEFIEDEMGDLIPIPVHETVDYTQVNRINFFQEWFYDLKKNNLEIQNVSFSPVIPSYDENNEYKGLLSTYVRKQHEFSSLSNRKSISKNKNIIWGQQIRLALPITAHHYQKSDEDESLPIKSVMNAQLANIIFNQIIEGKIKAYLPNTNTEYTTERIDSLMKSRIYTEYIENEYGDWEVIQIIEPYTVQDLGHTDVTQSFEFDFKTFKIKSTVKKITLTINIWDEFGDFKENEKLFGIRY